MSTPRSNPIITVRLARCHAASRRALVAASLAVIASASSGRLARAQGAMMPSSPYPVPHGPDSASFRVHRFVSGVFGNVRYLRVFLPRGYDSPEHADQRYPVLYLSDGQTTFESMPEPNHSTWRVEHTVDSLVTHGVIPPMIVVAIDNAGPQRAHEYLPYPFLHINPPEPAPAGRRYPDFLLREVVPFINMTYRTLADPSHTAIGGSSLGGLVAAFTVMAKPGVFGRVLIESPSFFVDQEHLFRDMRYVQEWPERIYVGVGTNEGARRVCPDAEHPQHMVQDVEQFATMLRAAGVDSSRIKVVIAPCAMHNEDAWAARLPQALTFLFGK